MVLWNELKVRGSQLQVVQTRHFCSKLIPAISRLHTVPRFPDKLPDRLPDGPAHWKPRWSAINLLFMKHIVLLAALFGIFTPGTSLGLGPAERCSGVLRAESFRQMDRDELGAHRKRVAEHTPAPVAEAMCESTAAITYAAYRDHLERARREYPEAGRPEYDPAELFFFLQCGEDRMNLSPLAYHAFNLNRDEYGFIGELTLAIVWMSIGYLELEDPDQSRSFMGSVARILAYARKSESQTEVEMYEDLLSQIEGFREDYELSVSECPG